MSSLDLYYETQLATTATTVSVNGLLAWQQSDALVLRPAFQRNMVWTQRQQALLIDSMLRGVPVPEIYIKTTTGPDGEEEHVVVDGQQRISACLDFVAGNYALLPIPESRPEWAGKTFEGLTPELRSKFRGFKFVARELPDIVDEVDIRAIFGRLNMTVEALEPQELRHAAYSGPFIRLVEDTAALDVFTSVGVFSAKDYLRRRSDEFVGEVYFALVAGTLPNKKEDLDEAYATFERAGFPSDLEVELSRRMGRAMALLEPIAAALKKTRFRNKSDLYSLLYFLTINAERLPDRDDTLSKFLSRLDEFSEIVAAYRKAGDDVQAREDVLSHPLGMMASKYWAGVSRAASDRGSRVARHQALSAVLEPLLLSEATARPLNPEDEMWRVREVRPDDVEVETEEELEEERRLAQEVIDHA